MNRMNRPILCTAVLSAATLFIAAGLRAEEATTKPTTQGTYDTISYGMGYQIGKEMASAPMPMNHDQLKAGLADALSGVDSKYTEQQITDAMMTIQMEMMAKRQAEMKLIADSEKIKGDAYKVEYAKKAGVTQTASGMLFESVTEGAGKSPGEADIVRVHYTGTLIDGTKFDSSRDARIPGQEPEPVEFELGRVIPGWIEGLQLMKVGGKAKLVIPSDLAYGDTGSPPTIPPGATLVFDVELLDIVPPATQPATPEPTTPAPAN
jgi:FKBP-type peptidyl-prolyl cis-trans isomerase